MASRLERTVVGADRGGLVSGLVASGAAVTVCTAAIFGLRELAPVLSLGVVYLLAVVVVSSNWGLRIGLLTGVLSALAFNFFHIPPTGRLSIGQSGNVVGLFAFLVAAVLASTVADAARRGRRDAEERTREADLSAELARALLGAERPADAVTTAARRLAQALGLPSAAIELHPVESDDRRLAFPLRDGAHTLGTLVVPVGLPERTLTRLQLRVVPALEAVLAAAVEREELQLGVVETVALRRGDAVKTALLRTISHDLRSPLTAIATAGEGLTAEHLGDADRRELGAVVTEEAARLTRLIDNLLDLSRLEAGAAEPRREWIALDDVLRAAAEPAAERFSFALQPDLPLVRADAAQLERAFANLLDNASRYAGGHPVSVRARAIGGRVVVRIVDRGPGIPAAQLERVFEPFFQAGGVADRRDAGVRARPVDRARLRGGERWPALGRVPPGPGRELRLRAPAGGPAPVRGRSRLRRRRRLLSEHRPRILVCDDEPQILRALRIVLREAGFDVVEASTVEEALDQAAVRPPAAAILDLILPDGTGIDVTRALRQWSRMPIIVLSAVGDEDDKVAALQAGADDYVTKPFGSRELVARLEAQLRRADGATSETPVIAADGFELDLAARIVRRDGAEVRLTPTEFSLLQALAVNRGRLMTHRALLVEVWGEPWAEDVALLRTHIARLRSKLEPPDGPPRYVRTEPGVGYRFAA